MGYVPKTQFIENGKENMTISSEQIPIEFKE